MNVFSSVVRTLTVGVDEPAANTAATITLAASSGERHVVRYIVWSYSASPTGGSITFTDGGTTKLAAHAITAAGPGTLSPEYVAADNSAVVVTLAAPGGTVVGKLTVYSYKIKA